MKNTTFTAVSFYEATHKVSKDDCKNRCLVEEIEDGIFETVIDNVKADSLKQVFGSLKYRISIFARETLARMHDIFTGSQPVAE